MSILKKAQNINFSFERPASASFEVNGARIAPQRLGSNMLAAACGNNNILNQLSLSGINTMQVGVRGQSAYGNFITTNDKEAFRFENYITDIHSVMNVMDLNQTVLFGYSHGGYFMLAYAIQNPQRVSSLILVEPAWNVPSEELKKRAELLQNKKGLEGIEAMLEYVSPNLNKSNRKKWAQSIASDWQSNDAIAAEFLVRAENPITEEDLASIKIPTLLLFGSESEVKDLSLSAARHIPNASIWCVEGANHLELLTNKAYTNEISNVVQTFLKLKS